MTDDANEARLEALLAQVIEAAKAKGVVHVHPTGAVGNEDSRSDTYHLICEMFGDNGTFRTIEALDFSDLAKLAGVEVPEDDVEALDEMLYDKHYGYWHVPTFEGVKTNPVLCFWSEPDNPYPGTDSR